MTGGRSGAQAGATLVLLTLAAGQFLMTLDTSVMNVAITTVAEDVGTDVTSGIPTRQPGSPAADTQRGPPDLDEALT